MAKKQIEVPEEPKVKDAYFGMKDVLRLKTTLFAAISEYAKQYINEVECLNCKDGRKYYIDQDHLKREFAKRVMGDIVSRKTRWAVTGGCLMKPPLSKKLNDGRYALIEDVTKSDQELRFKLGGGRELTLKGAITVLPTHFWRFEIYTKYEKRPTLVIVNMTLKDELERFVPLAFRIEKWLRDKCANDKIIDEIKKSFVKLGECRVEISENSLTLYFPNHGQFLCLDFDKNACGRQGLLSINGVSLKDYIDLY